jgi:hypothetical protein
MPIHDWSRVDAGVFHGFRQRWIGALCDALNAEILPEDHFALIEAAGRVPVLNILAEPPSPGPGDAAAPGAEVRGRPRVVDRIAVRHEDGRIIAIVEILSSEDKASDPALRAFVAMMAKAIAQGVHVLVVDPFPPGAHAPQGIHKAIWDELEELDFALPDGRPLIVASYDSGPMPVSYVEPFATGDVLPEMPLFLRPDSYVPTPLEASYQAAWDLFPGVLKGLLGR